MAANSESPPVAGGTAGLTTSPLNDEQSPISGVLPDGTCPHSSRRAAAAPVEGIHDAGLRSGRDHPITCDGTGSPQATMNSGGGSGYAAHVPASDRVRRP